MKRTSLYLLSILILLFLINSGDKGVAQEQTSSTGQPKAIPGKWTLSAGPYRGPGYKDFPVVVYSVTQTIKGLTVAGVNLQNKSSKPVVAARLVWRILKEDDPETVLLQGQTPLLALPDSLQVDARLPISFPVVSFEKIYQSLLKQGTLEGNFRIDVAVNDIVYDDGGIWSKSGLTDNKDYSETDLPTGKWGLSIGPYLGLGYKTLPVIVQSVTSTKAKGAVITRLSLINRSLSAVRAMQLNWYLTPSGKPDTILLEGKTPLLTLTEPFLPDQFQEIHFPVINFAKACAPLLNKGELNGDYSVRVLVGEVQYENGARWAWDAAAQLPFAGAITLLTTSRPLSRKPLICANQHCNLVRDPATGIPVRYDCALSKDESCSKNGDQCTDSICLIE